MWDIEDAVLQETQPAAMIESDAPDLHHCSSLCLCMVLLFPPFNLMARFAGSKMASYYVPRGCSLTVL